jgi:hypothetical protein
MGPRTIVDKIMPCHILLQSLKCYLNFLRDRLRRSLTLNALKITPHYRCKIISCTWPFSLLVPAGLFLSGKTHLENQCAVSQSGRHCNGQQRIKQHQTDLAVVSAKKIPNFQWDGLATLHYSVDEYCAKLSIKDTTVFEGLMIARYTG